MNLKEYVEELSKLFDQPDVQEVTVDVGIEMVNHTVIVNENSPNQVKFTVKRK